MPRKADPEQIARKKEEIAEHAARLFAMQGYENTSVAQVAASVGTSPASIFHYFPDKASLFRAPFESDLPRVLELIESHRDSPDALASILAVVEALAGEAAYPYAQGMLIESLRRIGHDPELVEASEKAASVQRSGLAELVAKAIDAGQVDPALDPDFTAGWLLTIVDACYLSAEPGRSPAQEVRRTALGYLKGPPP